MPGLAVSIEITEEAALYPHVLTFVSTTFPGLLTRRAGSGRVQTFGQDVATVAAAESGRWTRPDVAVLAVSRGDYVPYWRADLHTIEVKSSRGLDVTGVHEANAHGRFGHFAWLAFQSVGRASPDQPIFGEVINAAAAVGVGIIHFSDASNPSSWTVPLWPVRTGADNAVADAFVRQRFGTGQRERIRSFLEALGWPDTSSDNAH